MVYGVGINDMYWGWMSESEYNHRVYNVWKGMIERCYSEKLHKKYSTYKNCYCCERWIYLSNFVEDIVKIDNYEYWRDNPNQRISLDKDIKSNGKNKCYCLENCCFTSQSENSKQANKTRDNEQFKGENNPMYGKNPFVGKTDEELAERSRKISESNRGELVAQVDTITNKIVNLKYNREYDRLGFNHSTISKCCKNRLKTHKGYIFKYISDVSEEQLQEYYESLE